MTNVILQDSERAVTRQEGMALAQEHKCIFYECSAKTRENVQQCFKDLTLKVVLFPRLFLFVTLPNLVVDYCVLFTFGNIQESLYEGHTNGQHPKFMVLHLNTKLLLKNCY